MPTCIRCNKVGGVEGWGRRRNGWLKQLCPDCDAARLEKHRCQRCGISAAERPDWARYEKTGYLKPFCPDCYASGRVKQTSGKHRCRRCGALARNRPDWGRYERGKRRLKALCPDCDAAWIERRSKPQGRTKAEQRRIDREREAAKQGRELEAYVPQAERNRQGRMRAVERLADRIRARWATEWLRPFRRSSTELYWEDPQYRETKKAEFREAYRRHRAEEIQRVLHYKRAHPDRNRKWSATRLRREVDGSDGTATPEKIAELKSKATHCAYCGHALHEKQTDHMIPLVLGGEHSLRNIVIVCPQCNGRKARLSYEEWIARIEPQHRARLIALYQERYAAAVA